MALGGGWWLTPRPGRSISEKAIRYALYRMLVVPQDRSGRVRKISLSPAFDTRTVQFLSESLFRQSCPDLLLRLVPRLVMSCAVPLFPWLPLWRRRQHFSFSSYVLHRNILWWRVGGVTKVHSARLHSLPCSFTSKYVLIILSTVVLQS
jgi:hypothetical protein